MKKCKKCDAYMEDNAKFCSQCGDVLDNFHNDCEEEKNSNMDYCSYCNESFLCEVEDGKSSYSDCHRQKIDQECLEKNDISDSIHDRVNIFTAY